MRCLPRSLSAIVAAVVLAAPVLGASPRDELLRFVPDDVGFCFVMQDLRVHAADLADSPFVEQVRRSPLGLALRMSAEVKQLDRVDKELRQQLGVGWDQLRDDLLGDAVVFAYRPGPPGKPEQEEGLVLVRARTAAVLAGLVEKLNAAQKKDGTLTALEEIHFKAATYYHRVEAGQTHYYYLRDAVLLITSQEEMLRRALEAEQSAPAGAEPALARRLRDVGADQAALALWLNPRAFDATLEDKAAKAEGADALLQRKLLTWWKATDGVFAWATLDTEFHLSLAEQVRAAELPAAAQRVLAAASRPSEVWRYFPDDALLACGGRIDVGALLEMLQDLQPKDDANAAFGKDLIKDVLSRIGPDWGLCVTAPPADGKEWLPQALLAVRAAPGDETAPVDEALLSAIHTAALLGVLGYNRQHPAEPLRLKALEFGQQEIHFITGDRLLPAGVQPAYGLTNGWLALSSCPDAIRRFAEAAPKPAAPDGASFPLLRLSLKGWRSYVTDHREPLAAILAEKNGLTVEEMRKRLDDLVGALQFVDRLEVACRTGSGMAAVTLTIQTAQPLKK